uniref:Uncharacterized protein n=1 Tax=Cacopsylla melanoneura TaxID=428564 RepID=A0A8D9BJZ0_9HEMI
MVMCAALVHVGVYTRIWIIGISYNAHVLCVRIIWIAFCLNGHVWILRESRCHVSIVRRIRSRHFVLRITTLIMMMVVGWHLGVIRIRAPCPWHLMKRVL